MVMGGCWPDMEAIIPMGGGCWPRMDTGMLVWLLARHGSSHSNGGLLVSNGEVVWIGGSDKGFCFATQTSQNHGWLLVKKCDSGSDMGVLFLHEVAGQQ